VTRILNVHYLAGIEETEGWRREGHTDGQKGDGEREEVVENRGSEGWR